jgi:hypothetical protein
MTTKRIPGQRNDGMDRLKIEGKTFYAWGEYRRKSAATEEAERMRSMGHKARIVKRTTGYQVYCDSPSGVMGQ